MAIIVKKHEHSFSLRHSDCLTNRSARPQSRDDCHAPLKKSYRNRTMLQLLSHLNADEAGFIVSSELVLVATIVVIGLIVGLSEVANGVNQELEDVGSAVGHINQTFLVNGTVGHRGWVSGSSFHDQADNCDGQFDISCNTPPTPEWAGY